MIRRFVRWMLRPPCWGGLVVALLFFALSLTPSLLPRSWNVQGSVVGPHGGQRLRARVRGLGAAPARPAARALRISEALGLHPVLIDAIVDRVNEAVDRSLLSGGAG